MTATSIPYGRHDITQGDIDAVEEVLRSDFITQGPVVPRFERAVASQCSAGFGIAANSATSALHLACMALGVGSGDVVWTSAITFVASANCARYCGAEVDFIDIDPLSHNLCTSRLAEKLANAETAGTLPKVVIPVHLTGQPCDMAAIHDLGRRYGFRIIEDAAHAIGGQYRGAPIGNCEYSDITVFSFHPVKVITTGEGGMAVTNDAALAGRMARLRSHGITRDETEMTRAADGSWYYEQLELGYNYRLTEIQAALGLSQLERLEEYISARHAIASRYDALLEDLPVVTPWRHAEDRSALHLYVIRVRADLISTSHREVFERLRASGVLVNLHYIPVYRQPYYARLGYRPADFPEAERYYAEAISLPLFPALTEAQQFKVVEALRQAVGD